MNKFIIITTINEKTHAITEFEKFKDWHIVLVGDVKSVPIKNSERLTYLSIKDQERLGFKLANLSNKNHYARKNIGYLFAIKNGANIIYDTDDDNIPYDYWSFPDFKCDNICVSSNKFINIYKLFTDDNVWPRGYPLDQVTTKSSYSLNNDKTHEIGIWQGLADKQPDVDAIYRLIINKPIRFNQNTPFCLPENFYCPINSQNTLWRKEAFHLLYLPNYVSFRFTDILRGYIAQRLLWQQKLLVGYTGASVFQERNTHNLMTDFEDEIIFYTNTKRIVDYLDNIKLTNSATQNLLQVYEGLQNINIIAKEELIMCKTWLEDLEMIMNI